ncbi:hypothetical protein RR48_06269 [Papilio machaon]|uniref:Uncharacterized protein n=1 Tax=Papilio machaon TaxID=76193 RepID=A0A194R5T3_PAPMA|nr:hypothetical protein RR48_06269 [Papilio machaon]
MPPPQLHPPPPPLLLPPRRIPSRSTITGTSHYTILLKIIYSYTNIRLLQCRFPLDPLHTNNYSTNYSRLAKHQREKVLMPRR